MSALAVTTHIHLDDHGVAWIDDTNAKVVEVILDHLAYGHSAEEIQYQHPHLTLSQVHAAFSFYFDHESEMNAEIEKRYARAQVLDETLGHRLTRQQLLARLTPK